MELKSDVKHGATMNACNVQFNGISIQTKSVHQSAIFATLGMQLDNA